MSFLSHSCQILFGVLLGSFFVLDAPLQGSTLKRLQHKLDFFSLEGPDQLFPDMFVPSGFEKIHKHNSFAVLSLCSSILKKIKDKFSMFLQKIFFYHQTKVLILESSYSRPSFRVEGPLSVFVVLMKNYNQNLVVGEKQESNRKMIRME